MTDLPFEMNKEYDFYGVDNECFKIDDQVIEVLEDESDGYRSMLGSVELGTAEGKVFFPNPIDRVRIVDGSNDPDVYGEFRGYEVVGSDGHVWLKFGTGNYDDWYPYFIFRYAPKEAK